MNETKIIHLQFIYMLDATQIIKSRRVRRNENVILGDAFFLGKLATALPLLHHVWGSRTRSKMCLPFFDIGTPLFELVCGHRLRGPMRCKTNAVKFVVLWGGSLIRCGQFCVPVWPVFSCSHHPPGPRCSSLPHKRTNGRSRWRPIRIYVYYVYAKMHPRWLVGGVRV